ncbi:OmpA family protein [Burkholderia pyrrocinia]
MKKLINLPYCLIPVLMLAGCAGSSPGLNRGLEDALNKSFGIQVSAVSEGVEVKLPESALFEFGKSALRGEAVDIIERSVVLLQRSVKPIKVNGYTDSVGTQEYNQRLSEARAHAVASALIARGVSADRVSMTGFAAESPVANNDTPEGRQLNRRTEIIVVGEAVDTLMGEGPAVQLTEPAPPQPDAPTTTPVE